VSRDIDRLFNVTLAKRDKDRGGEPIFVQSIETGEVLVDRRAEKWPGLFAKPQARREERSTMGSIEEARKRATREILVSLEEQGLTLKEMARRLGIEVWRVSHLRKEYGLTKPGRRPGIVATGEEPGKYTQVEARVEEAEVHALEPEEQPETGKTEASPEVVEEESNPILERLAALAHEQWSGWMQWMIPKVTHPDPDERQRWLDRWTRQMHTSYEELSEQEKESDRSEARKVLALLRLCPTEETQSFVGGLRIEDAGIYEAEALGKLLDGLGLVSGRQQGRFELRRVAG